MEFSEIVKVLRERHRLSYRRFAAGVNEVLPADERFTPQVACKWELKRGNGGMTTSQFYWLVSHAPEGSWQHELGELGMKLYGVPVVDNIATDKQLTP